MAITYEIDQIVEEQGDKAGTLTVYVKLRDDAAPDKVLARTCVQGTSKDEIKASLKAKLPTIKQRLTTGDNAAQTAADAPAEAIQEEAL